MMYIEIDGEKYFGNHILNIGQDGTILNNIQVKSDEENEGELSIECADNWSTLSKSRTNLLRSVGDGELLSLYVDDANGENRESTIVIRKGDDVFRLTVVQDDIAYRGPIWKDTYYLSEENSLEYRIKTDGETIFHGRAYKLPNADLLRININKICQNYLSNEIAELLNNPDSYEIQNADANKVFEIYDSEDNLLSKYEFFYDWSYIDSDMEYDDQLYTNIEVAEWIGDVYVTSRCSRGLKGYIPTLYPLQREFVIEYNSGSHPFLVRIPKDRKVVIYKLWGEGWKATVEGVDYTIDEDNIIRFNSAIKTKYKVVLDKPLVNVLSNPINGHYSGNMYLPETYILNDAVYTNKYGSGYDKLACGDYAIYYLNSYGGWDAFLIEGNNMKTDSITEHDYNRSFNNTTIEYETGRYISEISTTFKFSTGWLNDAQAENLTENLLGSNHIYLHDLKNNKIMPAVMTNTKNEYKTYSNQGNKMISYDLNVKLSQNKIRK